MLSVHTVHLIYFINMPVQLKSRFKVYNCRCRGCCPFTRHDISHDPASCTRRSCQITNSQWCRLLTFYCSDASRRSNCNLCRRGGRSDQRCPFCHIYACHKRRSSSLAKNLRILGLSKGKRLKQACFLLPLN